MLGAAGGGNLGPCEAAYVMGLDPVTNLPYVPNPANNFATGYWYPGYPGFDPTRVKVVTENGTVYLMGLLKHDEATAVTNEVRQVGGVQRVVKLFEYID